MAQQFKVIINAGKSEEVQSLLAEQGAGQRGRPLIIKAKAGAKYQLVEMGKARDNNTDLAPDNIKAKRVGKHLHLMFETDTVADVIIEDYYDVMAEGYNGVIGKAENGSYYEYLTEDPTDPGLIPKLTDNATAVTQALGGAEVTPAGAAIAVAAFPLLGALGLLGGAAAVAAAANNNNGTTTTGTIIGKLDAGTDSGVLGDNITNDATPTLSGTVPTGSTATVTINGQTYPVTVNADGTWKFTQPNNLPDGTYTPVLNVTTNGVTTTTNLTPFTVDTFTRVDIGSAGQVGTLNPISGTAEPGDNIVVKDANGQVIGTATANSAGNWSLTPSAPVPAGLITATATATDAAGNTASDSDTPANSGNNPANNSLKTALTIDPIAADNVLLASESGATTYTVTGKVTGAFAPGDVVFLALHGKTYPAVVNADGAFSAIVTMADLKADPDTKIEGSITPTGGDPATAAQDYTVESGNVPTQTALSINPVTADNIIGSTESSGAIAITGKVTGKYLPGDLVSLTINGHTYTGVSATDGSYSIPVPAADLLADPDTQIEASVSGTGGTLAKAVQDYGVNPNVNPASNTTGKLDAGTDSGVPGDNKTNDASPTLSGTVPTGATATVSINGQTYPVTVNPNGTWSFTQPNNLPDGTYYPILQVTQNGVTTPTNLTPFTIDTTPPTVAVTSNAAALGTGQSATITFTLSENSTDFTAADIAVTGGTLSNLTQSATDPKVYTATFTPTTSSAPSTGTISVASGKFNDAAANVNADGAEANNTISLTTNATTYGALQQAVPNDSGVVGDNKTNDTTPTLSGKVPAGSTASVTLNGQKYPVIVNPDGTWSFTNPTNLPDGTYTPVLEVTSAGVTTSTPITPFTIDTTAPTVVVTSNATNLAVGQTASLSFTLSEASSDFTADDIAITGGALSNFQKSATDPKIYTATFTPSSTGTQGTISVASGKFSDAAANFNADGTEANNTVTLSTNVSTSGQLAPASDNSTGTPNDGKTNDKTPELSGKVPAGATATVTLNGQTYPVAVNPDGTWSFTQPTDLPDGTYTPQLNITTGGVTITTPITPFTIDTTPPTVAIASTTNTLSADQSTTLTFTVSEPSTDLSDADFAVTGGKLGPLQQSATNPLVYTATFNYKTDNTAPTIAITGPSGAVSGPSTITFTLSEVSSDFMWDPTNPSASTNDIVVTGGGTLSALTPSSTTPGVFTATYTPPSTAGTGTATISVASNKFSDAAGNFNTDGGDTNNSLSVNFDTVTPTVIVSRATNATLGGTGSTAATETITFTLSEASSDFTSTDVVVSAGALSNWTAVSSTVYTATYTPPTGASAATGTATIGVRSGKFQDAAGNQNADDFTLTGGANSNAENNNNVVSVAYDTVAPTQTASFSSMTKDSGLSTGNANWTTADASAGRLVSGFVSAPLGTGETVNVYVDKGTGATLLGTATVDAGGTTWEYTDTTDYVGATGATGNTAGWTYSAKVVDAAGNAGPTPSTSIQVVNGETTTASAPSAPTIDTVGTDATVATTIANNGSTGDNTLAVKGRGTAGNLVTLFDNTSGNVVKGGILVDSNGDWTADLTGTALGNGTHNFYAVQTNAQGTSSVLSNQYTVNVLVNMVSNGDFESGNAITQATGSSVTGWTVTAGNVDVLQVTGTKVLDTAGSSPGTISQTINGLIVGQTYAWSFTNAREDEVPDVVKFELTGATSLSQTLSPASNAPSVVNGTFVAQSTTVTMTFADTTNNGAADRGVLIDNVVLSRVDAVPAPNGSLSAGGTLTAAATAQADALTYSGSPLIALAGNDSPIAITAIDDANGSSTSANGSKDTGTSASDFITSDTTLVYRGTVPVEYNDANHDVFVEILNSSGTVVQSGTATVSNGTWSLDKTASALSAGNYTIRSTIVNQGTTTTTSSFGSQGVDTQALVIDTTAPTIIVARANNSTATLSTGQTETITFTLSEASTNFDVSDVAVSGGTLSNFGGSGTSYSATFTPTADTSGTGSISVASSKFSDAAGNQNADGAEGNNTASVPYVTAVPTQTVTFSSMTKDSSLALDNADWTTADGSAGRLVSGTLDAVLITGQVLKVYSNGTYIGDAVVNGKAWEITDTTGYTTGWTYTAKVQDGSGNTGPTTTQIVNTDFTEAAPVITSVIDTANASIGIGGTTTSALSTVSGTGTAGDTVYLYDNTGTNLVGSTTVAAGGAWSISGLATNDAVGGGTNTFSARQMDSLGNVSVLSNTWTVTAAGSNLLTNGNFASGFTGFSSGLTSTGTTYSYTSTAGGFAVGPLSGAGAMNPVNTATTANSGPTAYTFGTWSKKTIASYVNPNGAFSGDALYGEVQQSTVATILSQNVKVTAGKTYTFKFDYATTAFDLQGLRAIIDGASIDVTTKNNGQESGQFSVTYVATSDKTINLSLTGGHTRASDIIVQLRKFLRSGSSEFELISMSDVVEESVAMIQAELTRHEITLTQEVDSTVLVWADEGQLQMVVLNLLKNALDVLRAVPLPREIHVQLGQTAQANMLTVSDNGPGIDESDRARVFEVFFSTKAEGMGLGLWLSHSIVRNHGGELQVSSSPTGGACFTLTLHKKVA